MIKRNISKYDITNLCLAYPEPMRDFIYWIDRYSLKNNWTFEYHNLPVEIQVGLWVAFVFDTYEEDVSYNCKIYDHDIFYDWINAHMDDKQTRLNINNDNNK